MSGDARKVAASENIMTHPTYILAIILAFGSTMTQTLNAQQGPPTTAKGQTVKTVASLELASQIPELNGRYLRARMRTLEPGGNGLLHSHKELPVILYIVSGNLTVCTPKGDCKDIPEGQAEAEGKDVTHWALNRGATPVKYLAVEIGKEP